jgi:MFS family permease
VMGSLSDRYGRKPVLLISLTTTTLCYAVIATSLSIGSFALLAAIVVKLSLIVLGAVAILAALLLMVKSEITAVL